MNPIQVPDDGGTKVNILGIPSASPAVIELFRNFLRVIVFITLLTIDWLRADDTRQREFGDPIDRRDGILDC